MKVRHLVVQRREDGTARTYWQPSTELRAAGWRPMRLPDDVGDAIRKAEEMNAEVDAWRDGALAAHAPPAAKARARQHPTGSLSALVEDYRASEAWRRLAPRTRRDYGWCLDLIEAWAGDQPARAITPKAVQAFYEGLLRRVEGRGRNRRVIETPSKAAAAVRVLRLLLEAGKRLGYVRDNPASRPDITIAPAREPRIWTPEEVRQMAAVADAMGWRSVATAILLNEWIGQREGDVLRLP
jgi:integrase